MIKNKYLKCFTAICVFLLFLGVVSASEDINQTDTVTGVSEDLEIGIDDSEELSSDSQELTDELAISDEDTLGSVTLPEYNDYYIYVYNTTSYPGQKANINAYVQTADPNYFDYTMAFTVNVLDSSNNVVASNTYVSTANYNGESNFTVDTSSLPSGTYKLEVQNYYDDIVVAYGNYLFITKSKITAKDVSTSYGASKTFDIKITDSNGKPLVGIPVNIVMDGTKAFHQDVLTPKNGAISINLANIPAGKYSVYVNMAHVAGSAAKVVKKITISKANVKVTVKKVTARKNAKFTLKATVKDSKNKKITSGKVAFKVNGKTYTASVNKNGVASVKVQIKKTGTFTCKSTYKGTSNYKAKTVSSKVVIKK